MSPRSAFGQPDPVVLQKRTRQYAYLRVPLGPVAGKLEADVERVAVPDERALGEVEAADFEVLSEDLLEPSRFARSVRLPVSTKGDGGLNLQLEAPRDRLGRAAAPSPDTCEGVPADAPLLASLLKPRHRSTSSAQSSTSGIDLHRCVRQPRTTRGNSMPAT